MLQEHCQVPDPPCRQDRVWAETPSLPSQQFQTQTDSPNTLIRLAKQQRLQVLIYWLCNTRTALGQEQGWDARQRKQPLMCPCAFPSKLGTSTRLSQRLEFWCFLILVFPNLADLRVSAGLQVEQLGCAPQLQQQHLYKECPT